MLVQLLGPASRGRPILAVRLARVGAVTVFLRGQRLPKTQTRLNEAFNQFMQLVSIVNKVGTNIFLKRKKNKSMYSLHFQIKMIQDEEKLSAP